MRIDGYPCFAFRANVGPSAEILFPPTLPLPFLSQTFLPAQADRPRDLNFRIRAAITKVLVAARRRMPLRSEGALLRVVNPPGVSRRPQSAGGRRSRQFPSSHSESAARNGPPAERHLELCTSGRPHVHRSETKHFYEKVVKVKADVAAILNSFLPRSDPVIEADHRDGTRLSPSGGSRKGGFSGAL